MSKEKKGLGNKFEKIQKMIVRNMIIAIVLAVAIVALDKVGVLPEAIGKFFFGLIESKTGSLPTFLTAIIEGFILFIGFIYISTIVTDFVGMCKEFGKRKEEGKPVPVAIKVLKIILFIIVYPIYIFVIMIAVLVHYPYEAISKSNAKRKARNEKAAEKAKKQAAIEAKKAKKEAKKD